MLYDHFSELIRKISPSYNLFWIYILSHHKIPVPIGVDAKVFYNEFWNLPIHSVDDKIWRKSFEVYDTDSPVGEVWQLNFYYGYWNQPHD